MQILKNFLTRPYLYLIISLIGIAFKFYHLDYKLLWIDEVYTIRHSAGQTGEEFQGRIPVNEFEDIGFYFNLYRLSIQDYDICSQVNGLLASTQLNPLHYPFLMVWYRIVGDHPVHFRLFSVFIFIITLPFLFLLSKKLFDSDLAGWIAVSLYAVSPYFHLFAQEARYYIFWSFILVLLHYIFLLTLRYNSIKWWSAYTITAALSLYASPVSLIIITGHAIFVAVTQKDCIRNFGISMLIVAITYLPWALALFFNLDEITSALSWQSGNQYQVNFWLPLPGQLFYQVSIFSFKLDYLTAFGQLPQHPPPEALSAFIFNSLVTIILIMAFLFLLRKTGKATRYFLLLIIIPGLIFFYLNDLLRNGMTSWWWRYLIFIGPGIILVMTNLLYKNIEKGKILYGVCYLALILIGISSITTIAAAKHWHIGNQMNVYLENARIISRSEKPLIITDLADNRSMVDLMVVLQEC